jgi:multidrug resistance efflux pump
VLVQESRIATARANVARIERETSIARAEQQVIRAKLVSTREGQTQLLRENERRQLESTIETQQVIRAPRSGIVSATLASEGQSVTVGQALFTIASPTSDRLILRLLIPARSAASALPGSQVSVSFRAYPKSGSVEFQVG